MGEKILLVDDDLDISSLLKNELETRGYQVRVCDSGDEVIGALRSYKPDLLIMDVMLPGVDGYSLTSQIRDDQELGRLPLIIMSALTTSRGMFETIPQVAAFFAKPFAMEDLLETVKSTLAKRTA